MYRLLLALRYLFSRPINLLGVVGVMLGVWALVVVPSIFTGYLREVGRHLQSSTADLTIQDLPADVPVDDLLRSIEEDPAVDAVAPRIVWQGILHPPAPPERSRPPAQGLDELIADAPLVTLLGVDPDRELALSSIGDWLQGPPRELRVSDSTRPFTARAGDERPVLLMSRQRLERDGFSVGGTASMTVDRMARSQDLEAVLGAPPTEFVVGGCYESSFAAFDGLNIYVEAARLADILGGDGRPTSIAVRVKPGRDAEDVGARLERDLLARFGSSVRATTWAQNNSLQLESIRHQRGLLQMVLWVIMLVAGFVVYATQSMMVTEKTRDIGVLTALGANAPGVATVFLSCGGAVALLGVLLGVVTGVLSAHYLDAFNNLLRDLFDIDLFPVRIYNLRRVPYALEPGWIGIVSLAATLLGVLAAGLPAWRAARQDPLRSLRYE